MRPVAVLVLALSVLVSGCAGTPPQSDPDPATILVGPRPVFYENGDDIQFRLEAISPSGQRQVGSMSLNPQLFVGCVEPSVGLCEGFPAVSGDLKPADARSSMPYFEFHNATHTGPWYMTVERVRDVRSPLHNTPAGNYDSDDVGIKWSLSYPDGGLILDRGGPRTGDPHHSHPGFMYDGELVYRHNNNWDWSNATMFLPRIDQQVNHVK